MKGPEYLVLVASKMTEKALDLKVRGLLHDLGLAEFSFHPPDGTGKYQPGFPDWHIIGTRVLWRELKTMKGQPSAAQKKVLARLAAAGQDVDIWRPVDLYSGRITRELIEVSGLKVAPSALRTVRLLAA